MQIYRCQERDIKEASGRCSPEGERADGPGITVSGQVVVFSQSRPVLLLPSRVFHAPAPCCSRSAAHADRLPSASSNDRIASPDCPRFPSATPRLARTTATPRLMSRHARYVSTASSYRPRSARETPLLYSAFGYLPGILRRRSKQFDRRFGLAPQITAVPKKEPVSVWSWSRATAWPRQSAAPV